MTGLLFILLSYTVNSCKFGFTLRIYIIFSCGYLFYETFFYKNLQIGDISHKKRMSTVWCHPFFCKVSCCLFAFLVALVVNASHGASRRIDHVFERCIPLQGNRRATRYRRHRGHTACRLVGGKLFFKQRAVVIFLFRHRRIYRETFVYTRHLCVAYLCRCQRA